MTNLVTAEVTSKSYTRRAEKKRGKVRVTAQSEQIWHGFGKIAVSSFDGGDELLRAGQRRGRGAATGLKEASGASAAAAGRCAAGR